MTYSNLSETTLIEEARSGVGEAFDELYRRHANRIYRYIYPRINNTEDAEDLTGQVFLKAWEGLPKYKQRGSPFTSWLYRIAHNVVVDHYRANKQNVSIGSIEPELLGSKEPSVLDKIIADEELTVLNSAINQLSEEQKEIIGMRFYEGLNHTEIGSQINKSAGASRMIQMRAINVLNQFMKVSLANAKVASTVLALSCLFIFGGIGIASANALPGDFFYSIKRSAEAGRLALSADVARDATLHLRYSERRIEEFYALMNAARQEDAEIALTGYQEQINNLSLLVTAAESSWTEADRLDTVAEAIDSYKGEIATISNVIDMAPESAKAILNSTLIEIQKDVDQISISIGKDPLSPPAAPESSESSDGPQIASPLPSGPEDDGPEPPDSAIVLPAVNHPVAEAVVDTVVTESPEGEVVITIDPEEIAEVAEANIDAGPPDNWPADWPWPITVDNAPPGGIEAAEAWIESHGDWPAEWPWPYDENNEPWTEIPQTWPENWPWPPDISDGTWPERPDNWPAAWPWPPVSNEGSVVSWPGSPADWPIDVPWPPIPVVTVVTIDEDKPPISIQVDTNAEETPWDDLNEDEFLDLSSLPVEEVLNGLEELAELEKLEGLAEIAESADSDSNDGDGHPALPNLPQHPQTNGGGDNDDDDNGGIHIPLPPLPQGNDDASGNGENNLPSIPNLPNPPSDDDDDNGGGWGRLP